MLRLLIWSLPAWGAVVLFLVLFNNVYNGIAIYGVVLAAVAAACFIPWGRWRFTRGASPSPTLAVVTLSISAALLLVELAFPVFWPAQYAQVRELSKGFLANDDQGRGRPGALFSNGEQRILRNVIDDRAVAGGFVSWHVPGKRFTYEGYDPNARQSYLNRFRWNSLGYFDHDYPEAKPPGVKRIVVIGDSYVESIQVPLSLTFHKLLEQALNTEGTADGGTHFEVIALGSSGTGQIHHHEVLKERALRYQPDLVIVTLCSNDFCEDEPALNQTRLLAERALTRPFRNLVGHGYYALAFAYRRLEDLRREGVEISPELLQWSAETYPAVEAAWQKTLDTIRDSKDMCAAHNIGFMLVYLGSDLEVRYATDPDTTLAKLKAMGGVHARIPWDPNRSHRRVTEYCHQHEIILISLLEPLTAAQRETGYHVFGDHYTVFGHQVAATVLNQAVHFRMVATGPDIPEFRPSVQTGSWKAIYRPMGFAPGN
jgi:hypothetical protein